MPKFVVCDDTDLTWFSKKARASIQEKNAAFKNYRNNSSAIDFKCRLKYLQVCLTVSIEDGKEKYCHNTVNKLMGAQKNSKVYCSLYMFPEWKKGNIVPIQKRATANP